MSRPSRFEPRNPDYRSIAADTFERQSAMRTLGISIARLEPGETYRQTTEYVFPAA